MHLASPAQPEIDKELLDSLTVLEQAGHPRDSRAFVRIDTSHRVYWHTLFDICPQLLKLTTEDGLAIFRPFMAYAAEENLTFDWTYYLWVYYWLRRSEFRDRLDEELLLTMMGAAAARWADLDRSTECGIVLGSFETNSLVVGWKCRSALAGREVELIELEERLPAPDDEFGFFTLPSFELTAFPGWRSIPR